MKKLNKLFAILIAVLGVQTLSAQTDVTSTYLTNANFSSTSGWTQYVSGDFRDIGSGNIGGKLGNHAASSTDATHLSSEYFFGFQCRWSDRYSSYNQETSQALPSGVYTLSYDVENVNGSTSAVNYNNLFYVKVGDKTFTDTSVEWMKGKSSWTSHSITFVITEATKATVSLGYGTGSNNLASGSTPVLYVSHLKLIHRELDDISAENPADLTSYIVNNSFETGNLDGWTYIGSSDTGVKPNSNGTYTTSGVDGNYLFNTWWKGTPLTQTVANIPNGVYVLNVLVASGDGADKPKPNIFLTANGEHSTAYNISDGNNKVFHDVSYEFKVLNGQATIGVIGGNDAGEYVNGGHWWYKADNFRLTYKGADVSLLQDAFNANYTNLKNLSTEDVVPTAFAQKINDLISTYETAPTSKKDLTTANTAIESVVNAHPNIVTAYGSLKNLISTCNSLTTISAEQTSGASVTFATAISAATTAADAATTVTELNNAYNTLEAARRNYMQNAYPTSGNTLDFSYLIANGDWENNSGSNKVVSGIAHEEKYAENPWVDDVMWDEVSGLANGMYNVEVYLSASAAEWNHTSKITDGDKNTSITVNDVKTLVEVYKRKNLSEAAVITLEDVMVKDGKMNFMITNDVEGANWIMVAHKSITMTGKIDNTALQNRITALLTEANGIKDSDMNSTIRATLNTAINNADAKSEDPDALNQMIESLEAAIAASNPSIADYAKLKRYIAMTKVFTDVATYETKYNAGEYTADNVEPIRQELNVMRFNAASLVFPNPYEVTGWTGDLANDVRSDQHWSGDTKDYYDANSWNVDATGLKHTLSTTVTLPEGTYVLKAAGRSDSDVTLTLNIKDGDNVLESVEYTGKGDTGYGIDTEGHANFSADGTYANGNAGRGWEWEFAKFELNAETTVTLHVEVDYNNIQKRFGSFSDITLWMDDDTYVTVYGKKLDAPLAEAKALVNTLPMGAAENAALAAAIAYGEGELSGPGELNKAVADLETAVANAKAWQEIYYSKKPALVAALERFEADYNDAENGALGYMKTSLWTDVIEKVKAAALAKDDRTSHEGLTTATNALNAALDAAQASIDAYAALKTEINSAKNYTPIVAENTSEHSNDLNEAESGYNNATIETGRANELTAALQNDRVLDYNHVVEAYNVVELTGEWTGKTNVNHGEHWSGDAEATYFDYSRWSEAGVYEATKTVSLPAGEYVLMAAGRAADVEGTEAYIKVNDVKAIFPTKSSYGRGITKYGTATFNADSTYARDNVGYGWEYRFIAFTLVEEAEVTIVAGMNISDSWEPLAWAGVCTPILYTTPLTAAKENLENAISAAQSVLNGYPVGDGAFQVDANCDAYQGLSSAISTAQGVLNSSIVVDELVAAIEPLNTAVENYKNGYVLNAPEEGDVFKLAISFNKDWKFNLKPLTFADNGTSGVSMFADRDANFYAQTIMLKKVEGNKYTMSTITANGTELYVSTGSTSGHGNSNVQIRLTDDKAKALSIEVIPTATEGLFNLKNTEANALLGCQDPNEKETGGLYTTNNRNNFTITKVDMPSVTLKTPSYWATLILPFAADIPGGLTVYSCAGADGDVLTLKTVESIEANTPYLVCGATTDFEYTFTGFGAATTTSYTVGLFTGTYVDYKTTANSNTYVLQKNNGDVAFYLVGASAQPTVGAYRCYMTYVPEDGAASAPKFSFGRGEGTTSVDNMEPTANSQQPIVVYDLMGRKVTTMEKGGMYIVNGKKVVIK